MIKKAALMSKRLPYVLMAVITVLHLCSLNGFPLMSVDETAYLLLGTSLASGQGYRSIWHVGQPPHIIFPFMLPLVLSFFIYLFGYNFLILKGVITVAALFAIWSAFRFFERLSGQRDLALFVLALTGIATSTMIHSHRILSELPYLFLTLWAFRFFLNYLEEDRWFTRAGWLSGFFMVLASLTRAIGVSVFLGIAATLACRIRQSNNGRKLLFLSVLFFIPAVLWMARTHLVRSLYGIHDYVHYLFIDPYNHGKAMGLSDLTLSIVKNVYGYAFYAVPGLLTGFTFGQRSIVAVLLSALTLRGYLRCAKERMTVIEWYVAFFIAILAFNPWSKIEGLRYLVALIPFLFYYCIRGVSLRAGRHSTLVLCAILIASNAFFTARFMLFRNPLKADVVAANNFHEMTDWIKQNTAPDDVLLTNADHVFYLWTLRKCASLWMKYIDKKQEMLDTIQKENISYVTVDAIFSPRGMTLWPGLLELLQDPLSVFSLVYDRHGHRVYKVNRALLGAE